MAKRILLYPFNRLCSLFRCDERHLPCRGDEFVLRNTGIEEDNLEGIASMNMKLSNRQNGCLI